MNLQSIREILRNYFLIVAKGIDYSKLVMSSNFCLLKAMHYVFLIP